MEQELQTYKLAVKEYTRYFYYGEPQDLTQDIWTTIKLEKDLPDGMVIYKAKANLMKQIAMKIYGRIRTWQKVYIDDDTIQVIRV